MRRITFKRADSRIFRIDPVMIQLVHWKQLPILGKANTAHQADKKNIN